MIDIFLRKLESKKLNRQTNKVSTIDLKNFFTTRSRENENFLAQKELSKSEEFKNSYP